MSFETDSDNEIRDQQQAAQAMHIYQRQRLSAIDTMPLGRKLRLTLVLGILEGWDEWESIRACWKEVGKEPMTRDEITALEGRGLDAQVAERVCGMRKGKESSHWLDAAGHRVCGCAMILPLSYEASPCPFPPRYSTDLNACREAALAHPDRCRYADCLWKLTMQQSGSWDYDWAMADAATRCRAMLLALGEGR